MCIRDRVPVIHCALGGKPSILVVVQTIGMVPVVHCSTLILSTLEQQEELPGSGFNRRQKYPDSSTSSTECFKKISVHATCWRNCFSKRVPIIVHIVYYIVICVGMLEAEYIALNIDCRPLISNCHCNNDCFLNHSENTTTNLNVMFSTVKFGRCLWTEMFNRRETGLSLSVSPVARTLTVFDSDRFVCLIAHMRSVINVTTIQ